jgi:hypothetical protein
MMIDPEDKCMIEEYCQTAERFAEVLEFYRHSKKESRDYFDSCFKKVFGRTFVEYFSPLFEARPKAGRRSARGHRSSR